MFKIKYGLANRYKLYYSPQIDERVCGAAALNMLLRYNKSDYSLVRLRQLAKTDQSGLNASFDPKVCKAATTPPCVFVFLPSSSKTTRAASFIKLLNSAERDLSMKKISRKPSSIVKKDMSMINGKYIMCHQITPSLAFAYCTGRILCILTRPIWCYGSFHKQINDNLFEYRRKIQIWQPLFERRAEFVVHDPSRM